MTEQGGSAGTGPGGTSPDDESTTGTTLPSAMPDESTLTPAPDDDAGSIVPDQLHDAPSYVPPPVGMMPGTVMPPPDPAEVPTSAWITTAPTAPPKRGLGSRIGSILAAVIGVVIVGAVVAGILGILPNDKGKILFGTTAGKDLCAVGNETITVKTTDPVFFAAILKHHMDGDQAITFHVTKDGQEFVSHEEPADGTAFDCYGNRESLGALEPGKYVFEVIHKTDIEATGTLTVQ